MLSYLRLVKQDVHLPIHCFLLVWDWVAKITGQTQVSPVLGYFSSLDFILFLVMIKIVWSWQARKRTALLYFFIIIITTGWRWHQLIYPSSAPSYNYAVKASTKPNHLQKQWAYPEVQKIVTILSVLCLEILLMNLTQRIGEKVQLTLRTRLTLSQEFSQYFLGSLCLDKSKMRPKWKYGGTVLKMRNNTAKTYFLISKENPGETQIKILFKNYSNIWLNKVKSKKWEKTQDLCTAL